MTINLAAADAIISVLEKAPWALPCLSPDKDVLDQVRTVSELRPEYVGKLVAQMTNIEHRLNHPETVEAGLHSLLLWSGTYRHPETLAAVLDAGEYLDFHVQSQLLLAALRRTISDARLLQSSEIQSLLGQQALKQASWSEHRKNALATLVMDMDEAHSLQAGRIQDMDEHMVSQFQTQANMLVEAGLSLDGMLEIACRHLDLTEQKIGAKPGQYLPTLVLIEAGANWQEALDNPSVSDRAKTMIRGEPRVRKALLKHVAGTGQTKDDRRKRAI